MAWKIVPGTTIIETNKRYRIISELERISGTSSDEDVIHALETSASYTDIEREIERKTGADVNINSITARKIGTNLYEEAVEFTCVSEGSPALAWIAVIIVLVIIAAIIIADRFEKIGDLFMVELPGGVEMNLFAIAVTLFLGLLLVMMIRS